MVGGLPGKVKGRYPPGTLHRPCSVGDFNEVEDEGWNIDQMSDQEVASEFEKMLENMNLSEVISIVNLNHSFNKNIYLQFETSSYLFYTGKEDAIENIIHYTKT